jgi:two-component system chemotaxis response regulator CheY
MFANAKLSVLLVDDDDLMRAYLRIMVRDAGVNLVQEASTAAKALEILKVKPIDLVFLDINLPDEDGVEFIRTIKHHQASSQIIMVSSEATKDRVVQAMSTGAKDFIAKPFNASIVEAKIRLLIAEAGKDRV